MTLLQVYINHTEQSLHCIANVKWMVILPAEIGLLAPRRKAALTIIMVTFGTMLFE